MTWFLGVDASTQSLSAFVIDSDSGQVVHQGNVNFGSDLAHYHCPQGFLDNEDPLVRHSDPVMWAEALDMLFARMQASGVDFGRVKGISGSGQQHGTVYVGSGATERGSWLPEDGLAEITRQLLSRRTAPIWMDSATSAQCREITDATGGIEEVRSRTGSPAVERFSGPQIRKYFADDPGGYEATSMVHLVSSYMCSLMIGGNAPVDRGDGAGMNLLNLRTGNWDPVLLNATAPGLGGKLPALTASSDVVGVVAEYFVTTYGFRPETPVVAWSGDNPNSLIGVGGWKPGTAVVSLGTSDTYFAAMTEPTVDPEGYGHVFGNPAGGFMSLICFKNGSLAREAVRDRFELDWGGFEQCLEETPPGNNGNLMLPYFVSEITPLVLEAGPVCRGTDDFVNGCGVATTVRAVVEAQALRMRNHSSWITDRTEVLRVTGGGSANDGICQILADVFDSRVERLETDNSAALGAAMRAANAAGGIDWATLTDRFCRPVQGMAIEPCKESVAVYRHALDRYAAFAAGHDARATA